MPPLGQVSVVTSTDAIVHWVSSVVFLTTWPRRGSLTPSVKLAPESVSVLPAPPVAVPRSGVMSVVFGSRRTPKVTSKSTPETSALKLVEAVPSSASCRPERLVAFRSRSPKLAFMLTAAGSKLSFCSRNVSDLVADE